MSATPARARDPVPPPEPPFAHGSGREEDSGPPAPPGAEADPRFDPELESVLRAALSDPSPSAAASPVDAPAPDPAPAALPAGLPPAPGEDLPLAEAPDAGAGEGPEGLDADAGLEAAPALVADPPRRAAEEPAAGGEDDLESVLRELLPDPESGSASPETSPGAPGERTDPPPFPPAPDPASGAHEDGSGDGGAPVIEEPEALAFAADPDSEGALREGLSGHATAQVWPGTLRSAIAALGQGQSPRLLLVDLDGTAFPAGAIQELAAVCEVGTAVVAFGSNPTARFSREVLLAGVSDYLVKPLGAAAVRAAAARAAAAGDGLEAGRVAAFTGTGGSGATTLAALTALLAAERGRYVTALDLGRGFSALPFALDVPPAPGLDQLLESAGRGAPEAEMVEAVRAWRSDRIAVCGHRFGPSPPPAPPAAAVRRVLAALARESHLVLVDGLEDPATRLAALAAADTAVLVAEPTAGGAARAARLVERLDPDSREGRPPALVVNHTRALPRAARRRALRAAGVPGTPEAVVPFEPAVPALADRGWPRGKCPPSVAKPLGALVDRLLEAPPAPAPEPSAPRPRRGWRRWPAALSGLRPA